MDVDNLRGQNALLNLVLLSLAGVGGYLWLSGPQDSSRPANTRGPGQPAIYDEDVDAR